MNKLEQKNSKNIWVQSIFYMVLFNTSSLFAMETPEDLKKSNGHRKSSSPSIKKQVSFSGSSQMLQKSSSSSLSPVESQKEDGFPALIPEDSQKSSSSSLSPTSKNNTEVKHFGGFPVPIQKIVGTPDQIYMECVEHFFKKSTVTSKAGKALVTSESEKVLSASEAGQTLPYFEEERTFTPSEIGKILVYSYPLFIPDEKYLFSQLLNLKEKYPIEITAFLEQLALAAFPNGIHNMRLAEAEFNALKKGLTIPPILSLLLSNNFTPIDSINENVKKISEAFTKNEFYDFNNFNMMQLDINKFTNALWAGDKCLFESISLKEVKNFLEHETSPGEPIRILEKHFNRTKYWVALNVISNDLRSERDKKFKLFCCIATLLIERNHFWAALQIWMGLNNPAVKRVLSEGAFKDHNWENISEFIIYDDNYKNYRAKLNRVQGDGFLPILSTSYFDLQHDAAEYEVGQTLQSKAGALEKVSITIETFLRYRVLPHPDVDSEYSRLVCGFRDVHEEALEVFSDLWKSWDTLKGSFIDPSKKLIDWTPWYFVSMLEKNGQSRQIQEISEREIFDGKDIIAYMGPGIPQERESRLYELKINAKMAEVILSAEELNDYEKEKL